MSISWGSVADWVAGTGSFSAVIVALYLARSSNRVKLRVHIGHRIMIATGQKGDPPEYLQIGVVNTGSRVSRVTNVGYKIGIRKKQFAIQVTGESSLSSPLPIELRDGHEARWMIPLELPDNWIDRFCRDFLLPNWRTRLWSARVQIHTSVGQVFEAPFERGLKDKLAAACSRLGAESTSSNEKNNERKPNP